MTKNYIPRVCHECKHTIPHGSYCIKCGARGNKNGLGMECTMTKCLFCANETPVGAFCMICGKPQIDKTKKPLQGFVDG